MGHGRLRGQHAAQGGRDRRRRAGRALARQRLLRRHHLGRGQPAPVSPAAQAPHPPARRRLCRRDRGDHADARRRRVPARRRRRRLRHPPVPRRLRDASRASVFAAGHRERRASGKQPAAPLVFRDRAAHHRALRGAPHHP
eukprot:6422088-Prymnesium_polylepis.2